MSKEKEKIQNIMEDLPHIQETETHERRNVKSPPDMPETMRSMRVELQSYRAYNEKIIKS
jgi:hypothetical protein